MADYFVFDLTPGSPEYENLIRNWCRENIGPNWTHNDPCWFITVDESFFDMTVHIREVGDATFFKLTWC